jgi:hypothetical protein
MVTARTATVWPLRPASQIPPDYSRLRDPNWSDLDHVRGWSRHLHLNPFESGEDLEQVLHFPQSLDWAIQWGYRAITVAGSPLIDELKAKWSDYRTSGRIHYRED